MESSKNPFLCLVAPPRLQIQTWNGLTYEEIGCWKPKWIDSPILNKAREMLNIPFMSVLAGVDKEAFVCLCLDLWEEAHK